MAGSSVPVSWRYPPVNVDTHSKLKEIVGISYHTLDGYGFHGLEMIQCLAEQRKGGETGIKSVQCITGIDVWKAKGKIYDEKLCYQHSSNLTKIFQPLCILQIK